MTRAVTEQKVRIQFVFAVFITAFVVRYMPKWLWMYKWVAIWTHFRSVLFFLEVIYLIRAQQVNYTEICVTLPSTDQVPVKYHRYFYLNKLHRSSACSLRHPLTQAPERIENTLRVIC